MAKSTRDRNANSLTQRKRMISAINELLKEHDLADFKVFELKLEAKSSRKLTTDCQDLRCGRDEKKIQIRKPNGTIECICVPKKRK